jgi:DMSO/TMAO reductase YedYZ molybdopterin-dependent catalytic subunit
MEKSDGGPKDRGAPDLPAPPKSAAPAEARPPDPAPAASPAPAAGETPATPQRESGPGRETATASASPTGPDAPTPAVSPAADARLSPSETGDPEPAKPPEPPRPRPREAPASSDVLSLTERRLRARTRRDFFLLGAGAAAAAAGFWWLMPDGSADAVLPRGAIDALDTAAARLGLTKDRREKFLNRALTFDDDVAEALFSRDRSVRTYRKTQVTPLRNNYNGVTPKPDYLAGWRLSLTGLASGKEEKLRIEDLLARFPLHEQVTRLICVEGWSAVAWWGGIPFADLLEAFPPAAGSRWAALESEVNLDSSGESDPYYVSIDLDTARHRQTLLATHLGGEPLPVGHGAPLRLVAPMKLGLKNIKAITTIAYSLEQPEDYWAKRGYSKYDGL